MLFLTEHDKEFSLPITVVNEPTNKTVTVKKFFRNFPLSSTFNNVSYTDWLSVVSLFPSQYTVDCCNPRPNFDVVIECSLIFHPF